MITVFPSITAFWFCELPLLLFLEAQKLAELIKRNLLLGMKANHSSQGTFPWLSKVWMFSQGGK